MGVSFDNSEIVCSAILKINITRSQATRFTAIKKNLRGKPYLGGYKTNDLRGMIFLGGLILRLNLMAVKRELGNNNKSVAIFT